jgi:hypothetical protein
MFASAQKEGDDREVKKTGQVPVKTEVGSIMPREVTASYIKETTHPIEVVNRHARCKI